MNRDGFTISTIRKNSFIFTVNSPISSSIIGKRKLSIVKYSLGRLFMFPPVLYPRAWVVSSIDLCYIMQTSKKDVGKMANAYERHDISDESWAKIEFLLPGRKGTWGGNARDNRQFINAVFWILRTGAPWRDLPPSYGDWKNTHRRFCRWRDKGVWEKLLQELIDNPEFELLMIDASHIKVHAHGSGARGGNQDMAKTKGGSTPRYIWPWMRMVCRSESLLQKVPRRIVSRLKP